MFRSIAKPVLIGAVGVGDYRLWQAYRVKGGALFGDDHGSGLTDDSGFAYLPGGPVAELENGIFERPEYEPLGGPWYSFAARW